MRLLCVLLLALVVAGTAGSAPRTAPSVTAAGPAIAVDGSPTFPIFTWAACPADIDADLAAGVTAFMNHGEGCGSEDDFLAALGQRAYYVPPVGDTLDFSHDPRLLGYVQPDEPDIHGIPPDQLSLVPGRFVFLTLTPQFTGDPAAYRAYAAKADALGFDVYPLAQACGRADLSAVYNGQRALVALAAGRPTYQWIETGAQQGACGAPVTPPTVRAEAWLAIAGGARGLGWFTYAWPDGRAQSYAVEPDVAAALTSTSAAIQDLAPMLLAPSIGGVASPRPDAVKVGARSYGGATYVIAVNSYDVPVRWSRALPRLGSRRVTVVGEGRTLAAKSGVLRDSFAPLAVHVYAY
jgi:hypothetical protein